MLKTPRLQNYRNSEILAFTSNVLHVLTAHNFPYLSAVQAAFQTAQDNLNEANRKEIGNSITVDLKNLDKQRGNIIRGILFIARGFEFCFKEDKQKAAKAILKSIRKYSKNVAALGYQQETITIKNILEDWDSDSDLRDALSLLALTEWQIELASINQKFNETYINRSQIDAQKSFQAPVSELRKPLEDAYQTIASHLTANSIVNPSTNLTEVIAEINALIERYNLTVQRR